MSYDVYLNDPVSGSPVEFQSPHKMAGGTYVAGGTCEAWLNVTYNYSTHFHRVIEGGLRSIYGKTGAETIPILKAAIAQLADDVSDDYWEPTDGNAKRALCHLLTMAETRPDGIWNGD
jgi:hypothetical protein